MQRPKGPCGNAHRLFGKPEGPLTQGMPRLAPAAACKGAGVAAPAPAASVTQEAALPYSSATRSLRHRGHSSSAHSLSLVPGALPAGLPGLCHPHFVSAEAATATAEGGRGCCSKIVLHWESCGRKKERQDHWNDSGFLKQLSHNRGLIPGWGKASKIP